MKDLEKHLNEALREVALEIRTVDVLELASSIHSLKLANVGDVVHSALELHFKPHAITFGYSGDVQLGWFGRPSVSLDLELHNAGVDAYFCLVLEAMGSSVEIRHLSVDGELWTPEMGEIRLHEAIEQARLDLHLRWAAPLPQSLPDQQRLN